MDPPLDRQDDLAVNGLPNVSIFAKFARVAEATTVPADKIWKQIVSIGGDNGYYYLDLLWAIRGFTDRLIGGVGMRRERRHPTELQIGEKLDFWEVAAVDPEQRLVLVAKWKMPGEAVLVFEMTPLGKEWTKVTTSAYFQPNGLAGTMYWNLLIPVHAILFKGLARAIISRASR